MRIKLFIVTYNNPVDLHNNLETVISTGFLNHGGSIHIINNHSNFVLDAKFVPHVMVYHNVLRPDWSTGHLARNWNEAIINGFKDLLNPDCDILITCQDDTIFIKDWIEKLIKLHETYTFIQNGVGDNLCSYTVEAVRNIGLWDERFCNIGYQEADYFLRALIYNREKSCINDYVHGRLLNTTNYILCKRPVEAGIFGEHHTKSMAFHPITKSLFREKWGEFIDLYGWTSGVLENPPACSMIVNYMFYPYFEKDVYGLREKNYYLV
jgi:hypothetical protein